MLVSLVAFLALVLAGVSPFASRAKAQLPMFFGATRFPAIGSDRNNTLYLTMSVATAPASEHRPHSQIFFAMSSDRGANWNNLPQTRNLTNSPGEAFGPSVAVTQHGTVRVYVTYHDNSNGTTQIYLIRSKKKAKFRKPVNITPHEGGAFSPRVALDSNEAVNVVFGELSGPDRKVIFERSTDQGATFGDAVDVGRSSGQAFEPEIAVGPDDSINVVWEDTGPGASAIMFSRSTDGGQTFAEPRRVSTGSGDATEAHIAVDDAGRIHAVWVDQSPGNGQGFYARSTDAGQTFSVPINLTNSSSASIAKPFVTVFEDTVYIAYQDEAEGNRQVFLVRSESAGVRFSRAVQVSNADNRCGRAHSPSIVVDRTGTLHIVWIDASVVTPCSDEGLLFYSRSTNGTQFSPQLLILAAI
jgi:hypothetical protein